VERAIEVSGGLGILRQADNDAQVVAMWLHGRSKNTQRAYAKDAERFLGFAGVGIAQVTLPMLQAYADMIAEQADTTRNRKLSAVKSLLSFAHRTGYTAFNVGVVLKSPSVKNRLAERILTESEVQRIIALEPSPRNHVMLTLLYASGGRVSEVCGLKCKDCVSRDNGGQVTLFGKGGKTRVVLLSESTWSALESIRADASDDSPVFTSRKGHGHLDSSQVHRIVRSAADRAGIGKNVSPHWFRHAHASHALDRGCPIHLVQATLGHSSVATTGRYIHARPTESSAKYLAV
jgi:integrase/recombinase XerD